MDGKPSDIAVVAHCFIYNFSPHFSSTFNTSISVCNSKVLVKVKLSPCLTEHHAITYAGVIMLLNKARNVFYNIADTKKLFLKFHPLSLSSSQNALSNN